MKRFARGVTLTPEERRLVGLDAPSNANTATHRSSAGLVHSHSCSVRLPDGSACSAEYVRYGPRAHRFAYVAPVCQQIWITDAVENGILAIEAKAQEMASQAFRQAQQDEQKRMRRKTSPSGRAQQERPHMSPQTAARCAGCYCVCLRFESGFFMPRGTLYEDPDKAVRELAEGVHKDVRLVGGQRLVIAICNRALKRWQEPQFLALPTTAASPEEPPPSQETQISE